MPDKFNAERRHHIPKVQFKVRNWAEYEAGLRRRGSLTVGDGASHRRLVRCATLDAGGQAIYSDCAAEYTTVSRRAIKLPSIARAAFDAGRRTEAAVGAAVLDRMLAAGRPNSVRSSRSAS